MDIASVLKSSAERYPKRTALVFEERRWTYTEWFERVSRFARALSEMGVRPGDRVAFYVSTSENSVTTYFACQLLGAVAVPLNFRLSPGEVTYVLKDSGARILVYGLTLTENTLEALRHLRSVHDAISCSYEAANVPDGHHHFERLSRIIAWQSGQEEYGA